MIDPPLLFAFISVESDWNSLAFRNDRNGGSYGLMQLDYETARDRGYTGLPLGLNDPATNLKYGVAHLEWLTDHLTKAGKYSIDNLAAAYNAGLAYVESGEPTRTIRRRSPRITPCGKRPWGWSDDAHIQSGIECQQSARRRGIGCFQRGRGANHYSRDQHEMAWLA